MKQITIKYRPIKIIPFNRTIVRNYPQNWGEVNPVQLTAIACLYKNRISDIQFLNRMTGIPARVLKQTSDYERYKLMECFEFISDRRPNHEFIVRHLGKTRLRREFFAPKAKLKGLTFAQFIFADTYFSNYQESRNEEDLNKFIAALYLKNGEKFEEWMIEQRHEYIGSFDLATREAIALNWQLIHEWLGLAYPLIFQKREEQAPETASSAESNEAVRLNRNTWIKIFQNFVGDDILHDDLWAAKPINTIFTYMTRKYKENARRKN